MRAHLLIRSEPGYRRDSFAAGLCAAGFEIAGEPRAPPSPSDLLVIWNRYSRYHDTALKFEAAGARVVVAENGPLGRDWRGQAWYSIVEGAPAGAGRWLDGGPTRWEGLDVDICEWRKGGREVIVLAQRGIGPPGVRQPDGWHLKAAERFRSAGFRVRVREHPGERQPVRSLEQDLEDARFVVTWASGAAIKALIWGVPVVYGFSQWIGAAAAMPIDSAPKGCDWEPPEVDRLPALHRLAWSMWQTREIAAGLPFQALGMWRSGA